MPRFSLRTLMVVMLLGGPVLAGAWWLITHWQQLEREGRSLVLMGVGYAVFNCALLMGFYVEQWWLERTSP